MSVESFKKELENNKELKVKFEKEMEKAGVTNEKDLETIANIAQKLGYDVKIEDLKNAKIDNLKKGELNDEELDNISGGAFWLGPNAPDGHEVGCWLLYYASWDNYFRDPNAKCGYCGQRKLERPEKRKTDHWNKVSTQCLSCKKWNNSTSGNEKLIITDEPMW